jgi:hypothetical protein
MEIRASFFNSGKMWALLLASKGSCGIARRAVWVNVIMPPSGSFT